MEKFPQINGRVSLPANYAKSSVQRALDDRILMSEAADLAANILAQFPNAKEVSDGFIGALASVLMQYPRQCVLKCGDPLRGIAREIKFLSLADVVAWLEKETEPMRVDVTREQRREEQLRDREAWLNEKPSERLKELGRAWLDRTDPQAQQLTAVNTENAAAQKAAGLEKMQAANRTIFERECRHAGVDPGRGVSPTLLKTIGDA